MAAGSSSVCVALFKNTPPIGRENMPNIRIDARIPLGNRLLGSYDHPPSVWIGQHDVCFS
jgi:hypothetical protein